MLPGATGLGVGCGPGSHRSEGGIPLICWVFLSKETAGEGCPRPPPRPPRREHLRELCALSRAGGWTCLPPGAGRPLRPPEQPLLLLRSSERTCPLPGLLLFLLPRIPAHAQANARTPARTPAFTLTRARTLQVAPPPSPAPPPPLPLPLSWAKSFLPKALCPGLEGVTSSSMLSPLLENGRPRTRAAAGKPSRAKPGPLPRPLPTGRQDQAYYT